MSEINASGRTPVLVVDDDPTSLLLIAGIVKRGGYEAIRASSGEDKLQKLRECPEVRLVLTDWETEGLDGIDLIQMIRGDGCSEYRFVMVVTGRQETEDVITALNSGADDVLSKPVIADELLARLKSAERMFGLETRDALLLALANLAETRDTDRGEHIFRTQTYCRMLADELVNADAALPRYLPGPMFSCSPLHDIGKVGIPDAVLRKPGKLTDDEFDLMKTRTLIGARSIEVAMQASSESLMLRTVYDIARWHHEKWDGRGYPDGLAGDDIPLTARIMAVADVYDALRSESVYKAAMPHEKACAIIEGDAGTHFDPDVARDFLAQSDRFRELSGTDAPSTPLAA